MSVVDFVKTKSFSHLSLHFDGIMVDAPRCRSQADFGMAASDAVHAMCGFRVDIVQKRSQAFFDLLREAGSMVRELADTTGEMHLLSKAGLSVPLALAHASGMYQAVGAAATQVGGTASRTYQQWFRVCESGFSSSRAWAPRWGWRAPHEGHVLVHAEGAGRARCVCVFRDNAWGRNSHV